MQSQQENSSFVVLRIDKQRSSYYEVTLEGHEAIQLHEDMIIEHRIIPGKHIEWDDIHRWTQQNEWRKGYHRTLRWLSRKSRSIKEVQMKLKEWEYPQQSIDTIVDKCIEDGYLDDEVFAKQLTQYRSRIQKKGRKWIEYELHQKGIIPEYIQIALEGIDKEQEFEQAEALAIKKWNQSKGEKKDIQKVGQYLLRRGFQSSIVNDIIYRLDGDHDN